MAQQHHEVAFESEICDHLAEHGWLYSPTDEGYNKERAREAGQAGADR